MKLPGEKFYIKFHVARSVAILILGVGLAFIVIVPTAQPSLYRLLVDDRIAIVIPYLLFIALAESLFSIWYFLFRK